MLRCDNCDAKIDESQYHRTKFSMNIWCVDLRHRSVFAPEAGKQTEYVDLCQHCQDQAFADLKRLAEKFSCVARREEVPLKELSGALVNKEAKEQGEPIVGVQGFPMK